MSTNKDLEAEHIRVDWSMPSPGLTPSSWQQIHFPESPADPARTQLEQDLDWPRGTIDVLDAAFSRRLSRNVGWSLDHLPQTAPYIQAAKVFRRGVAHSSAPLVTLAGHYAITFSRERRPPAALVKDGLWIVDANLQAEWKLPLAPEDLVLDLDETRKNLLSVAQIVKSLKGSKGVVTIVGGGILADAAAFAAALEGRPFRLVPTTLLAMVDACVGGKTGVNFEPHGKNQLGLFAFPQEVVIHPGWLKTLPEREVKAGLAEAYKHALISGDRIFAESISQLSLTPQEIEPHLQRLVRVKADIIQKDPNEAAGRAVLNFGHTLAHALESISQRLRPHDSILHGEALAIGMRFACSLSLRTGYLGPGDHDFIQDQLRRATFMPTHKEFLESMGGRLPPIEEILEGILQDKKNVGDRDSSEWVLLKGFGVFAEQEGRSTVPVKLDEIKKTWATFIAQEDL